MNTSFNEFPHKCEFFRMEKDPNDFYGESNKVNTYLGSCDIQLTAAGAGQIAEKSSYTVFIPLTKVDDSFVVKIKIGDSFEGNEFGIPRTGRVLDITTSQLGFASILIESIGT